MKSFKQISEEVLSEGDDRYPADDMTMSELKIAVNAAQNILDMLEDGAMIQRWQISAIVKASDELASVCTNMRADVDAEMEDEEEWLNGYEEDEEPMYVGFEYPSMYGEETELDENIGGLFKNASEWESSAKARGLVVKSATHPSGEITKYQIAKDKQGNNRGHFDHGTKSGRLKEEVELDEADGTKRNRELLTTGRISKDEFDKRMGYGKYKTKDNSKKLDGPGGLYKNLVKRLGEEADLDEQIKGWKHAGSDLAKMRAAKGKDVKLVSLKKDGAESKMHDASKMFRSEDEAQAHHDRVTKLNPKSKIRHNLYVDGKHVKTLGEEVELDEVNKSQLGKHIGTVNGYHIHDLGANYPHKTKRFVAAANHYGWLSHTGGTAKEVTDKAKELKTSTTPPTKSQADMDHDDWRDKQKQRISSGEVRQAVMSKRAKNEETDYKVSVDGLPDMYVKADSPSEVKTNLRKIVKNPEMIRGVERVAKATLQKIFRDKAVGKEE